MSESPEQNSAERQIGITLQELRTSRGIDLEEVARITRIGKGYLAAIEEGRLDKLPSGAYSRGFIRQYAQFLGLGEAEIGALLAPPSPPEQRAEEGRVTHEKRAERGPKRRRLSVKGNWLISVLLLIAVGLIALVTGERRPEPPARPQTVADRPPAAAQPAVTNPAQTAVSSARREPAPPPAAVAGPRPSAGPQGGDAAHEGVVLRLRVIQDSWLNVTIDDALSQQYELKSGDVIEWKGERSFMLDVGNGAAFEGEFNGKPLQPLGEAGKPAHVVLRANAQAGSNE